MTPEKRDRVERVRTYMLKSDLPEEVKDMLSTLLDEAAGAANGSVDKLQSLADTLLALSLHEVKQAVREPERLRHAAERAVAAHIDLCPLRGGSGWPRWAIWVYPFRWQVMAAVVALAFAPRTPDILKILGSWWGVK